MTYRELLNHRANTMEDVMVQFKEVPEMKGKLPPAGMVARLTFICATEDLDTMDPSVKSWMDAPSSIQVVALTFNFSEFTAHNANLDEYDPGENSFPWLMAECGKFGDFYMYPKNIQLDDVITWFDVLPAGTVKAATREEIACAKHENAEIIKKLKDQFVKTMMEETNPDDPCYVKIRDVASKIDNTLMTLIDTIL